GNQQVVSFLASDGGNALRFNAGQTAPNGALWQRFTTVPGQRYTVSFDYGAYLNAGGEQRIAVGVQGKSSLLSQVVSSISVGNQVAYARQNFSFVADDSAATLSFQDVSATTDSIDSYLDNVQVVAPNL